MRQAWMPFLTLIVIAGFSGCAHHKGMLPGTCQKCPETCQSCNSGLSGLFGGGDCGCDPCGSCKPAPCHGCGLAGCGGRCNSGGPGIGVHNAQNVPPTAAFAYPYYTVKGPRDYFARFGDRSVGP